MILLHTGMNSPRLLAEFIGRYTPMKVSYAAQGEHVEHGHIYLASPGYHLIV